MLLCPLALPLQTREQAMQGEKTTWKSLRKRVRVCGRSAPADRRHRLGRTGRNRKVKHSQHGARSHQTTLRSETAGCWSSERPAEWDPQRDGEIRLHHQVPPRGPDLGFMERCSKCDLTAWRVSRAGKARKLRGLSQ